MEVSNSFCPNDRSFLFKVLICTPGDRNQRLDMIGQFSDDNLRMQTAGETILQPSFKTLTSHSVSPKPSSKAFQFFMAWLLPAFPVIPPKTWSFCHSYRRPLQRHCVNFYSSHDFWLFPSTHPPKVSSKIWNLPYSPQSKWLIMFLLKTSQRLDIELKIKTTPQPLLQSSSRSGLSSFCTVHFTLSGFQPHWTFFHLLIGIRLFPATGPLYMLLLVPGIAFLSLPFCLVNSRFSLSGVISLGKTSEISLTRCPL